MKRTNVGVPGGNNIMTHGTSATTAGMRRTSTWGTAGIVTGINRMPHRERSVGSIVMITNPKWKLKMENRLKEIKENAEAALLDEIITFAPAVKWLVATAAQMGIPLYVTRLGSGVTKIVSAELCLTVRVRDINHEGIEMRWKPKTELGKKLLAIRERTIKKRAEKKK